jgi:thiol-disulfide isomerase/thioredoxin
LTAKSVTANWTRLALTIVAIVVASLGIKLALPPQSTVAPTFVERQVPSELPGVAFRDGDGRQRTLADFRGKVVLLNVWATWCPPCRKEMPSLDRLQARLGSDDFEVVALSVDRGGVELVRRFYNANGIQHLAIEVDSSAEAQGELGITGLPTTLLIDRQAREIGRFVGAADWYSSEATAFLMTVIAGRPDRAAFGNKNSP